MVYSRSVAGIVLRGKQLLCVRRSPGSSAGQVWEFPGGKVEPRERPRAALIREFQEELGVNITVGPWLCTSRFQHHGIRYRLLAFQVYLDSSKLILREHTRQRWMDVSAIAAETLMPSDRKLLPALSLVLELP